MTTPSLEFIGFTKTLSHRVTLPPKQRWSRLALSRYLKSLGLLGSDYHTINCWEREQRLFRTIKEFRQDIPLDNRGNYLESFPFTAYQAWVVVKTAYVITVLRDELRGCKYLPLVAKTLANKEVQRRYLSREMWLYEINSGNEAA